MTRILISLALLALPTAAEAFGIAHREKVVYIGDSNTATSAVVQINPLGATMHHTNILETYARLRFPKLRYGFVNRAVPNTGTADALGLLPAILEQEGPDVLLSVLGGIDALGWQDKPRRLKRIYKRHARKLIQMTTATGARVMLCSYPILSNDPVDLTPQFLGSLEAIDEGAAELANMLPGVTYVDVFHETLAIGNAALAEGESTTGFDRIHLNDLGQAATGYAILKGLGALTDDNCNFAHLAITPGGVTIPSTCRTTVSGPVWDGTTLTFRRRDATLPPLALPLSSRAQAISSLVPFGSIARYDVAVDSAPLEPLRITASGRHVADVEGAELRAGVALVMERPDEISPGGPWEAQAIAVAVLLHVRQLGRLEGSLLFSLFPERDPAVVPSLANKLLAARGATFLRAYDKLWRDLARPITHDVTIAPAS